MTNYAIAVSTWCNIVMYVACTHEWKALRVFLTETIICFIFLFFFFLIRVFRLFGYEQICKYVLYSLSAYFIVRTKSAFEIFGTQICFFDGGMRFGGRCCGWVLELWFFSHPIFIIFITIYSINIRKRVTYLIKNIHLKNSAGSGGGTVRSVFFIE